MLRKLLILGICVGSSASVPIIYQASPETFDRLLQRTFAAPESEEQVTVAAIDAPARAAAKNEAGGRKVRIDSDARGHFLSEFKLNGRRVEAMVDTGATLVALNLSTARRLGLGIDATDFKYSVETANGSTRAATVILKSLEIGRIRAENVEAVVLDDKALSNTLIGVSFLNRLTKYHVENGTLVLVQ